MKSANKGTPEQDLLEAALLEIERKPPGERTPEEAAQMEVIAAWFTDAGMFGGAHAMQTLEGSLLLASTGLDDRPARPRDPGHSCSSLSSWPIDSGRRADRKSPPGFINVDRVTISPW